MNENEKVLETYIKQQQDMLNEYSQQNLMLNTRIKYLEEKLKMFDTYDNIIKELKRDKIRLERKVESLTSNNKVLGDQLRNEKEERQNILDSADSELKEILERKKLINKTSISGFSHSRKIQRN